MQDNDIIQVRKMLKAILKSSNHIHWIGGYVYGRTSNDDPFIVLYPAADYLKEKAVRVYAHDFKRLPSFIPTGDVPGDTDGNPDKEKAKKRGIYHECRPFEVVTYDGKETQMGREKRFGDVLRVAKERPQEAAPAQPKPNGRQVQPVKAAALEPVGDGHKQDLDGIIADLRATIDGAGKVTTIGFVCERAAMTKLYKDTHTAFRALGDFQFPPVPAGKVFKLEMGQKLSIKLGIRAFNWLVEQAREPAV